MRSSTSAVVAFATALAVIVWACGGREVLDLGGDAGHATGSSTSSGSSSGDSSSGSSGGASGSSSGGGGSTSGSSGSSSSGGGFGVAFTQQYVMACVWQIVPSAAYATYFVATAQYLPSAGGGTFNFTEQPLVMGATSITQVVGLPATVNGSPVTIDGQSTDSGAVVPYGLVGVAIGNTVIPAAANFVGGDIDLQGAALHLLIGPGDQICGAWTGSMTSPLVTELQQPNQNLCVFTPTTGSVAPITQAQVTCH